MTTTIKNSLGLAALQIGGALAFMGAARLGWISYDMSLRLTMAVIGLVLVIYANRVPKEAAGRSANYQAVKRVAGWALFLGGLGYVAAWLFAPIDIAAFVSMAAVIAAILYIFAYRRWRRSKAG
ncbi:hypothetical protein [Caulobacter sp. NIBR1757]|uniref:hypothetical protein n=1 Tax=Caulobacter sp. NIBR1757 TaxID=3016000 RepID=UPI0022F0D482|nr:hypothetical protein [Caulobacter sp. NIBR1757]WGM37585.1 hypothetical protein AMEJIAPC_00484 [Caulobacter sp. NIBR1757]